MFRIFLFMFSFISVITRYSDYFFFFCFLLPSFLFVDSVFRFSSIKIISSFSFFYISFSFYFPLHVFFVLLPIFLRFSASLLDNFHQTFFFLPIWSGIVSSPHLFPLSLILSFFASGFLPIFVSFQFRSLKAVADWLEFATATVQSFRHAPDLSRCRWRRTPCNSRPMYCHTQIHTYMCMCVIFSINICILLLSLY